MAVATLVFAALTILTPAPGAWADRPSLVSGTSYCRFAAVYMGYGVSIQPCEAPASGTGLIQTSVKVTGTATVDLRVYQAVAVVNSDGTVTDKAASTFGNPYNQGTSSATFAHNASDTYGLNLHLVVDSWISVNGVRIGSVQSPQFRAVQVSDLDQHFDTWSGFETYGHAFVDIQATWTAACVTGPVNRVVVGQDYGFSTWIGLGGDGIAYLEQVGIIAQPDLTFRFFDEQTPAAPNMENPNDPSRAIQCGDVILAWVSTSDCPTGQWAGYVRDVNNGLTHSKTCGSTGPMDASSAEFIDEGQQHLANFGHTDWSNLGVASDVDGNLVPPDVYWNKQVVMWRPNSTTAQAQPDQSTPGSAFTDRFKTN